MRSRPRQRRRPSSRLPRLTTISRFEWQIRPAWAYDGRMKALTATLFYLTVAFGTLFTIPTVMAANDIYWLDERRGVDLSASNGEQWRLVTDNVMGGVSQGRLTAVVLDDKPCLRMQGEVKLDNNGGFIQMALDLSPDDIADIDSYRGITLAVKGNAEPYNIHLRTSNLWLPWQSYRATFSTTGQWQVITIPFSEFVGYRLSKPLKLRKLKRIGLVAIGREFKADLCIGNVGLWGQ